MNNAQIGHSITGRDTIGPNSGHVGRLISAEWVMNKCIYMLPSTAHALRAEGWTLSRDRASGSVVHRCDAHEEEKEKEPFLQHSHTHSHTEQSSSGEISIVAAAVRSLISRTRVSAENNNRSIFRNPRLSTKISNQAQWFNSMTWKHWKRKSKQSK